MCGRQSGKTQGAIAEIAWAAMARPGSVNWWVTANYDMKARVWRGLLEFIPADVIVRKVEDEKYVILSNGSEIRLKSAAGDDSLVSESLDFVVCDEAGQWKEDAWFRGVSPMLAARPHAKAILVGTPRGKNWFHRLWLKGQPGKDKDAEYDSFKWGSADSPYVSQSFLAEQRRNLPQDIYKQEYEADPLDNSAGVFRNIRNCVRIAPAQSDQFTCIGADFARKHDFSCFIPMNSARQAISVSYRAQDDYPVQKQRLGALAMSMGFARIMADEASVGDPIIQDLRNAGFQVEGINTNGPMKRTLIENLRLALEQGSISIPDDELLIEELEAYEYQVLPSGTLRYSAPEGKHDDTVIALALALWGQRGALFQYMAQSTGASNYRGARRGERYGGH